MALGAVRQHLVDRNLVIAMHAAFGPQLAQEMHEVVGETVVVIDQGQHGVGGKPAPGAPSSRIAAKLIGLGILKGGRIGYIVGMDRSNGKRNNCCEVDRWPNNRNGPRFATSPLPI